MYTTNLVVNSPRMAGLLRCKNCHMNFQSQELLSKHKLKFCVGSSSDPDTLQLHRGLRSDSPRRIISPNERDHYRRNPYPDRQLETLAENHGRQMEYLQLHSRELEKQKEEIRRQLEMLGRRTIAPQQDISGDLLQALREQEIRNQRALDDLKRQLLDFHGNRKVNIIEVEKPVYHQPPPPPPPQERKNFIFPVYYGKSLVAEISAIRQAYLQNDGNDPNVLAQMAQMQAEAQAIEDQMNQKPEIQSPKEKPNDQGASLKMLEMENERLIQELRLLQEQNIFSQNRRKSDKEDELERELRRLQREHLEKMSGLQRELEELRLLMLMERNRPQLMPTTVVQQAAQPPVSLKPYVEVEPMAPYDQYGNRFDKRQITTAARSWVATQQTKMGSRPMYPVHENEFTEESKNQSNPIIPHVQITNRNRLNIETPALIYNSANQTTPILNTIANRNTTEETTKDVIGQTSGSNVQYNMAPQKTLRSDMASVGPYRAQWGQPIQFD